MRSTARGLLVSSCDLGAPALPEHKARLDRTYQLVAPGGWPIIEDGDLKIHDDVEYAAWTDVLKPRGVEGIRVSP